MQNERFFHPNSSQVVVLDAGETVGFKGFWRFFRGRAAGELFETLGYDALGFAKADGFLGENVFAEGGAWKGGSGFLVPLESA
jgi:hypothetical protein